MTTEPSALALVRIDPALRNIAKSRAAAQGVTLQEWIEEAIRIAATVNSGSPVATVHGK